MTWIMECSDAPTLFAVGNGGPTNVSLTLSSEWATNLPNLQTFDYGPGTLENFDSIFVKGAFPALQQMVIGNVILTGKFATGRICTAPLMAGCNRAANLLVLLSAKITGKCCSLKQSSSKCT